MNIELAAQDTETALVNGQGRLDAAVAPSSKQQITITIAEGNVRLALHLAHVSFMDTTGRGAQSREEGQWRLQYRGSRYSGSEAVPADCGWIGSSEFSKRAKRPCISSSRAHSNASDCSEIGSWISEHGMIRTGRRSSPTISIMISLM
jgi:hypothetical protein